MKCKVLLLLLFLSYRVFPQGLEDNNRILNQYIVLLQSYSKPDDLVFQFPSLQVQSCLSQRMNIWLFQRDSTGNDEQFLTLLRKSPSVKLSQFNHSIRLRSIIPNDPYFNLQWNMWDTGQVIFGQKGISGDDIDATNAWAINHRNTTILGDSLVIAVVDVGFDATHEDLNFFVNRHEIPCNGVDDDSDGYVDDYDGWNAYTNSGCEMEPGDDHSMNCAGIAAAIGNNGIGVAGVCWGAQIMRVDGAAETEATVVIAYDYVATMRALYNSSGGAKGAFVVSSTSSFGVDEGNPADYPLWCAMYDTMGSYGILSAVATSNNRYNIDQVGDIPSACPSNYLISVTNIDNNDNLQAAWGPTTIDLGAPGTNITSAFTNNAYGSMTGTSQATPHVAGAVAALYAAACPQMILDCRLYPDSIARAVKRMILTGVSQVSSLFNETVSNGRLNLYRAMLNLVEYNCQRCTDTVSVSCTQPACSYSCDASASVSAGGSSGFQYFWSTGQTGVTQLQNLCPGAYSVIIMDSSGCMQVRNFYIPRPDSIVISSVRTIPAEGGAAGNIIVTASAGNYVLQYSLDSINYSTSHILVFQTNGVYTVYVKNQNGCLVTLDVNVTTAIEDVAPPSVVSVYPNPAGNMLNVALSSSNQGALTFSFYNAVGDLALCETKQIPSGYNITPLDISPLAEGIYLLKMSNGNSSTLQKIVVLK